MTGGRFAWDHNAYYHGTLLRLLPERPERVLDVGCGEGAFATELASRARQVDALDSSPEMIAAAERATPANVCCVHADLLSHDLPREHYDAIVSVTALHHMPLDEALPRLANALRPGGVLAAIALPRKDFRHEPHVELAAATSHRGLALVFALARGVTGRPWYAKRDSRMPMVLDPPLTTPEVRAQARSVLPGAEVRRLLFWRYLLTWRKPAPRRR